MHTEQTGVWKQKKQVKSEQLFGLSWALTWTAQQTQRRSTSHLAFLLRFRTPAPSSLPFEVGPSAVSEVKLIGRGENEG